MTYYPVFIPTLNRFTHFRNCVESLSRCTHANKTELVIGLDYPPCEKYVEGYQQIKEYIPTITGFEKITVIEHEKNLGPGGNWKSLVDYCKIHYDAYIGSEDDNVFSPAFLDYMDQALELFRNDEKIVTVSGYNFVDAYNQGGYTCYFSKDNCAWGTGYWTHKEDKIRKYLCDDNYFIKALYSRTKAKKIVNTYPALYSMLNSMIMQNTKWGDVMRTTVNILEDKYQLKPAISLVRNCGYDGSGIHCGIDERGLSTQSISKGNKFDFTKGIGPANSKINKTALYNHALSPNPQKRKEQIKSIHELYKGNTAYLIRFISIIRCKLAIRSRFKQLLS